MLIRHEEPEIEEPDGEQWASGMTLGDVVIEDGGVGGEEALCSGVVPMLHPMIVMAKHKPGGMQLRFCSQEIPVRVSTSIRYVQMLELTAISGRDGFRRSSTYFQPTSSEMGTFVPRQAYPHLSSIPRSYYLGHHAAGLSKMKSMVSQIDLVIECRDYRTPIVSRNPLFEANLGERPRLIVYTKQDLGSNFTNEDRKREATIRQWDTPSTSFFTDIKSRTAISRVVEFARAHANQSTSLFGTRLMVVGMPNVGKSSLLNALRNVSLGKAKAARTGDQPGVTRKIGTDVKIIDGEDGRPGVYVLDTPGVFVPYVPDAESMLKLALCGNVKDTIIPPTTIADYLLFHLNLNDPTLYNMFSEPTNDIFLVLDGLARKQGRLKKGGLPDFESSALQFVQRWRTGNMGRFILDTVTEDALLERTDLLKSYGGSMHQARKAAKQVRKESYLNRN